LVGGDGGIGDEDNFDTVQVRILGASPVIVIPDHLQNDVPFIAIELEGAGADVMGVTPFLTVRFQGGRREHGKQVISIRVEHHGRGEYSVEVIPNVYRR
jgi:hypothetical protein